MALIYTEKQIDALVEKRKPRPADWQHRTRESEARPRRTVPRHQRRERREFRLILQRTRINGVYFPLFWRCSFGRRRRCFGCAATTAGHAHTKQIEDETPCDFTFISRRSAIRK